MSKRRPEELRTSEKGGPHYPLCTFCGSSSGSREHLWPKWIHERKDFGALRFKLGASTKILPNPKLVVKTVCGICNNGWMSDLEAENIPIIGSMLQDIAVTLDEGQQNSVAVWSVKTAMMSDSMKGRSAPNRFYHREECQNLRLVREIPNRTRIWIGRFEGKHLGNFGTDFTIVSQETTRIGTGSAVTIVAGHFITQVVTLHIAPECKANVEVPAKPGNWDNMLVSIWPIDRKTAKWPPAVSFTNGGPNGIGCLMDRWRIGNRTDLIVQ